MKRIFTLCTALCTITGIFGQTDTTGKQPAYDTIRIGGMVIIRKAGGKDNETAKDKEYKVHKRNNDKPSNLSTNWWIVDLGFSSYKDNSNYSGAAAQAYAPGSNNTWFDLKDARSRNINLWFFMQKLNIAKHYLNLKYGLGLE
ncbi:MAG TPA: hypothetical protein VN451_06875, partial [Chitinophagaceae bacterium]|nr:hypothetical protein [Chitinophagaceae bacterium]